MRFVKHLFSILLAAIGLIAAAAAIFLSMHFVDAKPMLLTPPDVARGKVIMLMNAVAEGNYEEASQAIYGTPDLGVDREAGDDVGVMIWDAFEGSVTYELQGDCYTTDQGLAQNDIDLSGCDQCYGQPEGAFPEAAGAPRGDSRGYVRSL